MCATEVASESDRGDNDADAKQEHGLRGGDFWERRIARRLRRIADLSSTTVELPQSFLSRPAPTPRQILARLPVSSRTVQVLRLHLVKNAPAQDAAGASWTYGRLVSIARFGLPGLLDVLDAMATWRDQKKGAARAGVTASSSSEL